jgi:type I restriction enzyme S subunit
VKYSKYKQSTTPWFREIPQDWGITKIGRIASKIGSGKTPRGGAETYPESGVLFIRSQNVYNEGLRLDDVAFIEEAVHEEMSDTRVYRWDVLLNITGASLGRCSLVVDDIGPANVNQHVCIVRPNGSQVNPAFLWLAMVSDVTENQIFSYENGSSREGINFQQVRNLWIPLPPISEQGDIVKFLGRRLSNIDTLIRKKEELIEKLQEKKAALISRTVTRGLPPDAAKAAGLNPHPKMKDSGIEWVGGIPEHWEMKKSKYLANILRVSSPIGQEMTQACMMGTTHSYRRETWLTQIRT